MKRPNVAKIGQLARSVYYPKHVLPVDDSPKSLAGRPSPKRRKLNSAPHDARGSLRWLGALGLLCALSCKHAAKPDTGAAKSPDTASASASASAVAAVPASSALDASAPPTINAAASVTPAGARPDPRKYRWLGAENLKAPKPVDSLEARFPTPPGYQRVANAPGSFGEWLRGLPLAAGGTPVVNNSGDTVFKGDDDYVAAVVAIDVGAGDLQQSSDAVVRLHAEWLWGTDKPDAISYRSASKLDMPFSRWAHGQRLIASGPNVFWVVKGKPKDPTYDDFRQYIDAVMLWTNSVSLATRATRVTDPKALAAGDFFLQTRGKGHAILVLDLAEKPTGERVALLGQAMQNPAQSFHVIRLGRETAWFSMRPPNPVLTPRSDEFSWADLVRLEPKKEE
jgi:Domain of unknown function (4846)